jgi:YjbE family integral membrane protein
MEPSGAPAWIGILVQMFLLDLLLCADNAVVIAMLCRSMPPADARKAMVLGTRAAVGVRLVMTVVASFLLTVPYLKGAAALILFVIAINSTGDWNQGAPGPSDEAARSSLARRAVVWPVVGVIVLVDTALGLDNVVALAAIARGNFWLLAAGVLLTIPATAFGRVLLAELRRLHPSVAAIGRGFLGWIAGGMAISDPAIATWANSSAPALVLIAPALGALFAVVEARILAGDARTRRRATAGVARPSPSVASAVVESSGPSPPRRRSARLARAGGAQRHRIVLIGSIALSAGMIVSVRYLGGLLMRDDVSERRAGLPPSARPIR